MWASCVFGGFGMTQARKGLVLSECRGRGCVRRFWMVLGRHGQLDSWRDRDRGTGPTFPKQLFCASSTVRQMLSHPPVLARQA